MAPVAAPLIPKPTAKGAPTPVDNITAPAPSAQIVTPIKTVSVILIIFATRKYFLLKASRLLISSSKNFCTSNITLSLYEWPSSFLISCSSISGAVGAST